MLAAGIVAALTVAVGVTLTARMVARGEVGAAKVETLEA